MCGTIEKQKQIDMKDANIISPCNFQGEILAKLKKNDDCSSGSGEKHSPYLNVHLYRLYIPVSIILLYIRVILKISNLVTGKLNITSYCTMNIRDNV